MKRIHASYDFKAKRYILGFDGAGEDDVFWFPEDDKKGRMRCDWDYDSVDDFVCRLVEWINNLPVETRGEAYDKVYKEYTGNLTETTTQMMISKISRNINAETDQASWKIKAESVTGDSYFNVDKVTIKGNGVCTNNVGDYIQISGVKE